MKKIFASLLLLLGGITIVSAQCDKQFKLEADTVYQLQPDSSRGDDIPGRATIKLTKDSIHVIMYMNAGDNFELKGKSTQTVCKMNADYSNGFINLVYDAVLYAKGNERMDKLSFTVTSKAGTMKLVGTPESNPSDKICFVISKKEELT